MKRVNQIEISIICGVLLAVAALFFPGVLPSAVFWPEEKVARGLGKLFIPHDQENIVIWLPVHFVYWGFIGWLLGFICTWIYRKLHRG